MVHGFRCVNHPNDYGEEMATPKDGDSPAKKGGKGATPKAAVKGGKGAAVKKAAPLSAEARVKRALQRGEGSHTAPD